MIAASKGGFVGLVTMWVLIEIDPALWPQLYGARDASDQRRCSGSAESNSRSNLVWVATKLGDISLDPVQEELFCRIRESLVGGPKGIDRSNGQKP